MQVSLGNEKVLVNVPGLSAKLPHKHDTCTGKYLALGYPYQTFILDDKEQKKNDFIVQCWSFCIYYSNSAWFKYREMKNSNYDTL